MALSEHLLEDDIHPIDIVETLAAHHDWDFDRIADDQIAMAVEGLWRTYSIRVVVTRPCVCTFELEPPEDRQPDLYALLNEINDQCWAGSFTFWPEQKLMVYRYGLVLAGGQIAGPDQIDRMIGAAVTSAERYYPALQLLIWGGKTPRQAIEVAIAEAYGRA